MKYFKPFCMLFKCFLHTYLYRMANLKKLSGKPTWRLSLMFPWRLPSKHAYTFLKRWSGSHLARLSKIVFTITRNFTSGKHSHLNCTGNHQYRDERQNNECQLPSINKSIHKAGNSCAQRHCNSAESRTCGLKSYCITHLKRPNAQYLISRAQLPNFATLAIGKVLTFLCKASEPRDNSFSPHCFTAQTQK